MTPDDAFLQAILANPDDDAPRLIYADFLEEHGQPERAEFIRVQITLARTPADDPRRPELEAQERRLLTEHEEEWVGPLRPLINDWVFHRGMLGVAVDVPQFMAHAATLSRSPLVHYLDIVDHAVGRANIQALAASPLLARVTILNLGGWYCYDDSSSLLDDEQVAMLVSSPHAARLESLILRCNQIRDAGAEALATSAHLARLTELDLRANLIGDAGVLALASAGLPVLTALDLSYNDGVITEVGWQGLADSPNLDRLQWLYLGGNNINDGVRRAFLDRLGDRVYL